jgi:AAA domain
LSAAPYPPIEAYADEIAVRAPVVPINRRPQAPTFEPLELLGFTLEDLRKAVREERYLLPGLVPTDAYTLIAGALSSYKTMLMLNMLIWRATGFDLLGLHSGEIEARASKFGEPGPCVLCSYEDTDWRIFARLQRILLGGEQTIRETHGAAWANEFLELATKHIKRIPLSGKLGKTLVTRLDGYIVPNYAFLDQFTTQVRALTAEGVLIGLDPLRLAIAGSQNDDDGADVTVQVLNGLSVINPGSGVLVVAHTNKAVAKEGAGNGYADAAYATSGSALYSQHARSNLLLARMKPDDIQRMFGLPPDECKQQTVAKLTHGRLSHGAESIDMYVRMDSGLLVPIAPRSATISARQKLDRAIPLIAAAFERLARSAVRVTTNALADDGEVSAALGGRKAVQDAVRLLTENDYLEFTGTTKNRTGSLTEKCRAHLRASEPNQTESH